MDVNYLGRDKLFGIMMKYFDRNSTADELAKDGLFIASLYEDFKVEKGAE